MWEEFYTAFVVSFDSIITRGACVSSLLTPSQHELQASVGLVGPLTDAGILAYIFAHLCINVCPTIGAAVQLLFYFSELLLLHGLVHIRASIYLSPLYIHYFSLLPVDASLFHCKYKATLRYDYTSYNQTPHHLDIFAAFRKRLVRPLGICNLGSNLPGIGACNELPFVLHQL